MKNLEVNYETVSGLRKPKTQVDEAIYAMLLQPSVTSLQMHLSPYWISNFPDVIFRARNQGYLIETKIEERHNKFGRKITMAKWELKDKEAALKMYQK